MRFFNIITLGLFGAAEAGAVSNLLGKLDTTNLPNYLDARSVGNESYPWGDRQNPHDDPPDTGVTRHYDFTFSRGKASPDGFEKDILSINGQSPGPVIEANWGDWIEVVVHNNITGPDEGTALHWHGMLQKETPWMDGLPSVQQCPIAPNATFTYRFRADRPGTTWYHSHYSAQYAGGLYGALIIYGPSHVSYDIDVGPIFVSDYFHRDYFSVVKDIVGTDEDRWPQPSDNTLINARGNFNCSLVTDGTPCHEDAGLSQFRFEKGKTYKLRLINSGAAGLVKFSIDNHELTVTTVDFTPIRPYKSSVVTLAVGQRTELLVKATGDTNSSYYMRATQVGIPCARANQPNGTAIILYDGAPETSIPPENPHDLGAVDPTCSNDPVNLTVPYFPQAADLNPATTRMIIANQLVNETGSQVYEMDGSSFYANYNNPLLQQVSTGNLTFERRSNVYDFGSNKTVRINMWNNNTSPHPMHLHGYDMTILSVGDGKWDGKTIMNAGNPLRRDVQMLSPYGHLVVQFEANNPGVWAFHCHIAWHLSMGFYVNFLIGPDEVTKMDVKDVTEQTCKAWNEYSGRSTVMQIDDGV